MNHDIAQPAIDALILAAGRGTRMPSPRPKVLQTILGESMLSLVLAAMKQVPSVHRLVTVVGCHAAQVKAELERHSAPLYVEQTEQLGTGHALRAALAILHAGGPGKVLVVSGDTPLVDPGLLQEFIVQATGLDIAFLSMHLEDPARYGRVVRAGGRLSAIIEASDYDPAKHGRESGEINTGVYCINLDSMSGLVRLLKPNNQKKEYYITDLIALALARGLQAEGIPLEDLRGQQQSPQAEAGRALTAEEKKLFFLGVNNPRELAQAETALLRRRVSELMASGVIIHAPQAVKVSPFAQIAPGAELHGPCEIYGRSRIAYGAVIESHCWLRDAIVGEHTQIKPFCHIENAEIKAGCLVGPYARLRPGSLMEENSHLGNFVEMKKSRLGRGSKANHLSYLGDAEIGADVNIGAGTITCNYDGKNKHPTIIGDGSFIGSNTALVAPISLGENTLIGAGSVITKNVPAGTLAVTRSKQLHLPKKK